MDNPAPIKKAPQSRPSAFALASIGPALLAAGAALATAMGLDWPSWTRISAAVIAFALVALLTSARIWALSLYNWTRSRWPRFADLLWHVCLDKPSKDLRRAILLTGGLSSAAFLALYAAWPDLRTWSLVGLSLSLSLVLAYYGLKCCRNKDGKGKVFCAVAAYLISLSANYLSDATVRDDTTEALAGLTQSLRDTSRGVDRANAKLDRLEQLPSLVERIDQKLDSATSGAAPASSPPNEFEGIPRSQLRAALAENATVLEALEARRLPPSKFEDNRLEDVLHFYAEVSHLTFRVDWPALARGGVTKDTEISVDWSEIGVVKTFRVSLEESLDRVFAAIAERLLSVGGDRSGDENALRAYLAGLWGVRADVIVFAPGLPPVSNPKLLWRFEDEEDPVLAANRVAKKIMALSLPEIKPRAWLPLARDALERRKTNPRFESVPLAEALMAAAPGLGVVDRWADAEAILRESLGMLTRLGGSHESLLECTDRLALALDEQNKPGAAYQVEAELLANLRASGSVRPVVLAESMGKVAYWSLRHPGESPRSLALYDEALDAFRKAAEDKRTAGFLVRAGGELTEHGHVAKGRTFSEEAMKLVKALPPTDGEGSSWGDTSISLAQTSIAVGYAAEGQRDEARRRFDIAWDLVVKHGIQNEFVGHIVKRERKSALRE